MTAWAKYRDKVRSTAQGRERHREEMRRTRAKKKIASVGDQLFLEPRETGTLPGMTSESACVAGRQSESSPVNIAATQPVGAQYSVFQGSESVTWTLFVVPDLFAEAQRLLESQHVTACACCDRSGRVARIVVRPEKSWTTQERATIRRRHERMRL